eukprot:gene5932-4243_t
MASTAVRFPKCSCHAGTELTGTDISTFSVSPQAIVFRSFQPNKLYEATITFKNLSYRCEYLRVACPASHVFSLSAPQAAESSLRVCSGLTVTYKIHFTPEANKDYSCLLHVLTDHGEMTVPLCAHADRGMLQLPDTFVANPCPVKGSNSTTLFLRNAENEECMWRASVDAPFTVFPAYGTVPGNGGLVPVEVQFSPSACQRYDGTISFYLGPDGDMIQDMAVSGEGVEADVRLEPSSIEFIDTYVTRERQTVVQVANNSGHTIHFSWKGDYDDEEVVQDPSLAGEGSHNQYNDTVFSIEPSKGVLYDRGVREFTVTFNPQLAIRSTSIAYLDVVGKSNRLPLTIVGRGVGPQCRLEYTRLNIGDIFMNELHEYEITIENTGCIEAVYTVLPPTTLMGRRFSFTPDKGVLAPAESQVLKVQLQSDIIGAINEIFPVHLHGSVTDLTLQFKGRILGPTYHFDIHELDFGNVSYNFWHSRTFYISNTSRIPMNFSLRLPYDSPFKEEFVITPSSGCIPPKHAQIVQVNFLSNTVGEYDTAILMDMADVGDAVDCLPLKAICMVPPLYLTSEKLSYGLCFVGYDYVVNLEVANDTPMSGKFEISMLDVDGLKEKVQVTIGSTDQDSTISILEPHSRVQVPITLRTLDIGSISFSLSLHILGSTEAHQTAFVTAMSRGPPLEVEPAQVSFGRIKVLSTEIQEVVFKNPSPIEAHLTMSLASSGKEQDSKKEVKKVFSISPTESVIEPFGKAVLRVEANLDAAMTFRDSIIVNVRHSPDCIKPIPVVAVGRGYALVPDVELSEFNILPLVPHAAGEKNSEESPQDSHQGDKKRRPVGRKGGKAEGDKLPPVKGFKGEKQAAAAPDKPAAPRSAPSPSTAGQSRASAPSSAPVPPLDPLPEKTKPSPITTGKPKSSPTSTRRGGEKVDVPPSRSAHVKHED